MGSLLRTAAPRISPATKAGLSATRRATSRLGGGAVSRHCATRRGRSILAQLALAAPALAQTSYFTTPSGFGLAEGNSEVLVTQPFHTASSRFQYIDGSQSPTTAKTLKGLDLRRRATEVPGVFSARTTNVTLVLAHATFATVTTTFAQNYKNAQATTVYAGTLNLPDLGPGPLQPPAPWSVTIAYTTPFPYNGTDALLVEFRCQGTTPANLDYPLDTVDGSYVPGGYGIYNGFEPCQVSGRSNAFYIYKNNDPSISGSTVSYDMRAADGPGSQAAVWILGLGQSYTNLGGALCAHIQPTPDIAVPMLTNALGEIGSVQTPVVLSYSYPGFVHRVFAQFAALDPSQNAPLKIALTDDIKYTVGDTGPYNVKRVSSSSSSTAVSGVLATWFVPIMRHAY